MNILFLNQPDIMNHQTFPDFGDGVPLCFSPFSPSRSLLRREILRLGGDADVVTDGVAGDGDAEVLDPERPPPGRSWDAQ